MVPTSEIISHHCTSDTGNGSSSAGRSDIVVVAKAARKRAKEKAKSMRACVFHNSNENSLNVQPRSSLNRIPLRTSKKIDFDLSMSTISELEEVSFHGSESSDLSWGSSMSTLTCQQSLTRAHPVAQGPTSFGLSETKSKTAPQMRKRGTSSRQMSAQMSARDEDTIDNLFDKPDKPHKTERVWFENVPKNDQCIKQPLRRSSINQSIQSDTSDSTDSGYSFYGEVNDDISSKLQAFEQTIAENAKYCPKSKIFLTNVAANPN